MKLLSMTAWFGRLDGDTLELHDGLNLLYAPNESGKTTWAAFLRAMLFGLDTRERDSKAGPADKNRYRPWSGHPMEGEILLEHHGQTLRLKRWTGSGSPMGCFSLTDAETGAPVAGCTASNCGEYLLGISREVFARTAYIAQDAVPVSQNRELERRILSLLSSGEEEVSWSDTDKTLRRWESTLTGPRGSIPRLETERARCKALLEKTEDARARIYDARKELHKKELLRRHWADIIEDGRNQQQRQRSDRFRKAVEALENAREEEERQRLGLPANLPSAAALREGLDDCYDLQKVEAFHREAQNSFNDARKKRREKVEALRALSSGQTVELPEEEEPKRKQFRLPRFSIPQMILSWVPFLAALILLNILPIPFPHIVGTVFCVISLLLFLIALIRVHNMQDLVIHTLPVRLNPEDDHSEEIDRLNAELSGIDTVLERLRTTRDRRSAEYTQKSAELLAWLHTFSPGTDNPHEAGSVINRFLAQLDRLEEAHHRVLTCQEVVNTLRAAGCGLEDNTVSTGSLNVVHTDEEISAAAAALRQVEIEINELNRRISLAEGELTSYGDPSAAGDLLSHADARLTELRRKSEALSLARSLLQEAGQSLQSRFSPRLNELAGEYARRLTGGKYQKVTLDQSFAVQAEDREQIAPRDVALLSSGTADQIYLAIRLALCRLILEDGGSCPLVLDDALLRLDDERLRLALQELCRQNRQILLFTCTGREKQAAAALGIPL